MRVLIMTREYPPHVYGGAGVHVEFLVHHLQQRQDMQVQVQCFAESDADEEQPDAVEAGLPEPRAIPSDPRLQQPGVNATLGVISRNLEMAAMAGAEKAEVIHSHTWYTNLAGQLASQLYGIPHVITSHSLEPLRPWKAAQLGGGYAVSGWIERSAYEQAAAVIAVSEGVRRDILRCYPRVDPARVHVVTNGVDTTAYSPDYSDEVHRVWGIDTSRPYVLFVGRVTPQKGLDHLLDIIDHIDPCVQIVVSVGSPDTDALWHDCLRRVQDLQASRGGVVWIDQMLSRQHLVQLFSRAAVFVCPSIYEPLGLVNLEAMACGVPVVASAVGGIPEVVQHGRTGLLVSYDPADPQAYHRDLAQALGQLLADPAQAQQMGRQGLLRVQEKFSWTSRSEQIVQIYRQVLDEHPSALGSVVQGRDQGFIVHEGVPQVRRALEDGPPVPGELHWTGG